MISIIKQYDENGATLLRGLSTDTKPTGSFSINGGDIHLTNGSEYECMDNGDKYLYDEQNTTWYKITESSSGGSDSGGVGTKIIPYTNHPTTVETNLTLEDFVNTIFVYPATGNDKTYLSVLTAFEEEVDNTDVIRMNTLDIRDISELSNYNTKTFTYYPSDGTIYVSYAD